MSAVDRQAFDAVQEYVARPLVFLAEGAIGPGMRTTPNGTGTLLRTPGGRVLVLTARHVLEDDRPEQWAIGGKISHGIDDALGAEWLHPNLDLDVGLALLKPHAAAALESYALAHSAVAEDGAFRSEDHQAILCGFPGAYRSAEIDQRAGRATVHFQSLTYGTTVDGLDAKSRYKVRWQEWYSHDDAAADLLKAKSGEPVRLEHPRGISGGPLWRFDYAREGELWDPSRVGRIIGIASTFLEPHEFVPSVEAWGAWFRETLAKIDGAA